MTTADVAALHVVGRALAGESSSFTVDNDGAQDGATCCGAAAALRGRPGAALGPDVAGELLDVLGRLLGDEAALRRLERDGMDVGPVFALAARLRDVARGSG